MSLEYEVPEGYYYTREHEWVKIEKNKARVGITDYAQKKLREVIFVELPNVGQKVKQNETLATIESVKASADVYSPVTGKVVEVNSKLIDSPELVNEDPYGEGWIALIELTEEVNYEDFMDSDEYGKYLEDLEEVKTEE
ncbi:MAG: glycine cleavage system protein GcvH [Thaumarchaeota archaeon]|jgi:glycine cleavage system H protein|nr:glycine cleavage system protein GcvH [Candidatus Geocrenenecus arthurdayi]MCL7389438.1 glycine cleavage system protein GcvH [Candidatus Geocrenenecus arthurdayi]MCL7391496.1 glycine cleavage system protein GcvH [Candidatus Geocrenenecus arthurdayi]MCL7396330.1 glycine cleavage system protein GcvH [Candidatus Geocrenenecus arthurdayi]MCL7402419.1 glycine cleavage system protein GcvH [Candidatus Geocrenenecus arthurdayi]